MKCSELETQQGQKHIVNFKFSCVKHPVWWLKEILYQFVVGEIYRSFFFGLKGSFLTATSLVIFENLETVIFSPVSWVWVENFR